MDVMHQLWIAAGQPKMLGNTPGTCRVCGQTGIGLLFEQWARKTFTDWDKLVPGDIICQACQFAFAEASPELAKRVGKKKPQRMRNYSHFVLGGVWHPLSKGAKREISDLLLANPDVAIVAISGQKHLITDHPSSSYGQPTIILEGGELLDAMSWTILSYEVVQANQKEVQLLQKFFRTQF